MIRRAVVLSLALAACSENSGMPASDGGTDGAADAAVDGAAGDLASACPRLPAAADRVRHVVISHPYTAGGAKDTRFEVLALSATGTLSKTAATFSMGRLFDGEIVFTPDGELGFVAQEDGTLGAFRLDAAGMPTVLQAGLKGAFYAARLVMDPTGQRLYVLDAQTRDNGGGVYALAIGCDGTLTDEGLWAPAKLPYSMVFLPGDPSRAVISAKDFLASTGSDDTFLAGWSATPQLVAQASGFGSADAIISAGAITPDGKYALFADNGMFSSTAGKVAVLSVGAAGLAPVQLLSPLPEPAAIVVSPFGNAGLVVLTNTEDALVKLTYDASNATAPFAVAGELAYTGKKPALPAATVVIDRGALKGRVLIAENEGVRQVAFAADGSVTDLGAFAIGTGLAAIVGGVGVQP
jgi:DNA-binding beta-propeller fold protein YncE